jgi:hypothetical protein
MFIDDERFPPEDGTGWAICRSLKQVRGMIRLMGFPSFISFDHDLGENEPTGMDITKWLVHEDMDKDWMKDGFDFYVHSQNPIGVENIRSYLNGYKANRIYDPQ